MIMDLFFQQKIVFQEIVQSSQFSYDSDIHYLCNDTCRIIVGNDLPFLLGILNSKLFFYAVKLYYGGGVLGENGIRMKHTFFENFPCIPFDRQIAEWAIELIHNYSDNLADILDKHIYLSYSLTGEEIDYIEKLAN